MQQHNDRVSVQVLAVANNTFGTRMALKCTAVNSSQRPNLRNTCHDWFLNVGFLLAIALSHFEGCRGEETLQTSCAAEDARPNNATVDNKVWEINSKTIFDFEVSGVNLGRYTGVVDEKSVNNNKEQPPLALFELYEDFNIQDQITGNEAWKDLVEYRRILQRPSLSFYTDKVARKRWLPTQGYQQPDVYALKYANELTETGDRKDEYSAIRKQVPSDVDYAAKPTHMSSTLGVWLVKYDDEDDNTIFTNTARELTGDTEFDAGHLVDTLAEHLHMKPDEMYESWALRNVKPGIVMEELYTDVYNENAPPLEFNIFTIWGRVWISQVNYIEEQGRYILAFTYRNGTMVSDASNMKKMPHWVDWPKLVDIAERLGAHKDMFRTDIFVGVSSSLESGATVEEREAAAQYAVSESEIYPTSIFVDQEICDEGARLWVAGYKMLNYYPVPNTEVPPAFLETGQCAMSSCDP